MEVPKRFTQTFYLAVQNPGYYVLNDVFRYLKDSGKDTTFPVFPTVSQVQEVKQVEIKVPQVAEPTPVSSSSVSKEVELAETNGEDKRTQMANISTPLEAPQSQVQDTQPNPLPKTQDQPPTTALPVSQSQPSKGSTQKQGKGKQFKAKNQDKSETTPSLPTEKKEQKPAHEEQVAEPPPEKSTGPATWASVTSALVKSPPATPTSASNSDQPSTPLEEDATGKNQEEAKDSSLYLTNLPFYVTEEKVKEAFSSIGNVVGLNLIAQRGYGFIDFDSPETTQRVLSQSKANPILVEGRPVSVEVRRKQKDKPQTNQKYQRNQNKGTFHDRRTNSNGNTINGGSQKFQKNGTKQKKDNSEGKAS